MKVYLDKKFGVLFIAWEIKGRIVQRFGPFGLEGLIKLNAKNTVI